MKYFQTWQDFMRMPENKALKESKGIHACKQKFIQEQNKMQWYDPMILTENGDAGISVPSAAGGGGGGGASFITGFTANVDTFTWAEILTTTTGSMNMVLEYNTIKPQIDFSQGHTDSRNKVGIFILSSSVLDSDDLTNMGLSTSQYDVVVTASVDDYINGIAGAAHASASIGTAIINNWGGAAAGSVFVGHTNPSGFAPSVLGTFTTGSRGTTVVFTGNKGSVQAGEVDDAVAVSGLTAAQTAANTGSMATTTGGNDTFYDDQGEQIFNGLNAPYSNMPRKY